METTLAARRDGGAATRRGEHWFEFPEELLATGVPDAFAPYTEAYFREHALCPGCELGASCARSRERFDAAKAAGKFGRAARCVAFAGETAWTDAWSSSKDVEFGACVVCVVRGTHDLQRSNAETEDARWCDVWDMDLGPREMSFLRAGETCRAVRAPLEADDPRLADEGQLTCREAFDVDDGVTVCLFFPF